MPDERVRPYNANGAEEGDNPVLPAGQKESEDFNLDSEWDLYERDRTAWFRKQIPKWDEMPKRPQTNMRVMFEALYTIHLIDELKIEQRLNRRLGNILKIAYFYLLRSFVTRFRV